ncbi:hypothetical protein JCM5353_006987 [Sporobolomyces roseus]
MPSYGPGECPKTWCRNHPHQQVVTPGREDYSNISSTGGHDHDDPATGRCSHHDPHQRAKEARKKEKLARKERKREEKERERREDEQDEREKEEVHHDRVVDGRHQVHQVFEGNTCDSTSTQILGNRRMPATVDRSSSASSTPFLRGLLQKWNPFNPEGRNSHELTKVVLKRKRNPY